MLTLAWAQPGFVQTSPPPNAPPTQPAVNLVIPALDWASKKSCQIVWLISVTSANETTTLIFPDLLFSFPSRAQTGTLIPRGSNLVY